jgi:hypothetical protein
MLLEAMLSGELPIDQNLQSIIIIPNRPVDLWLFWSWAFAVQKYLLLDPKE